MPLEHPTVGLGALEQSMTGAAGTTHPKEGTFGGITALMGPTTTLTEETSGPLGGLEGFLCSWCP